MRQRLHVTTIAGPVPYRNSPAVRHAFPLPDSALLRSLPDFNCEFKTNSADASVPPQSNPPRDQADGAAGALQVKLDYERQCYRHAAMIAHDRLRNLQASVGETIKLIDVGARSGVPLRIGLCLHNRRNSTASLRPRLSTTPVTRRRRAARRLPAPKARCG